MKLIFCFSFLLLSTMAFAEKKVAVVKMLRGEVDVLTMGKTTKLKVEDWVESGAIVKTAEKSFAKLVFIDKSQMNVGPNSEMKIEKFSGEDAGVIDLVKGKIRSQVTKDYLQIKDKDKSKLFIKTPTAVMGIRGTDFMISTNGSHTSAVLFEGSVVFNRTGSQDLSTTQNLERVVSQGVRLQPGDFSVVVPEIQQPTVPSKLNIQQLNNLEKNQNFESDRSPSSTSTTPETKSIVPAGLNGMIVSNNTEVLKTEVAQVTASEAPRATAENPDGYIKGQEVKPANGSFLHVESGVIIPPGPGSVLDANTNTYIPAGTDGKVGSDGSYVPPKNVEITTDGKIMVATTDKNGETKVQEAPKPSPVVTSTTVERTLASQGGAVGPTPVPAMEVLKFNPAGTSNFMNNQMQQGGGINNVMENVATGGNSSIVPTRIVIKPHD